MWIIFNGGTTLFVRLNIKWFNLLCIYASCQKTPCYFSIQNRLKRNNLLFCYNSQHVRDPLQRTILTYSQPQWMDKMSTKLRVQTLHNLSNLKITVSLFNCFTNLQIILLSKSPYKFKVLLVYYFVEHELNLYK